MAYILDVSPRLEVRFSQDTAKLDGSSALLTTGAGTLLLGSLHSIFTGGCAVQGGNLGAGNDGASNRAPCGTGVLRIGPGARFYLRDHDMLPSSESIVID